MSYFPKVIEMFSHQAAVKNFVLLQKMCIKHMTQKNYRIIVRIYDIEFCREPLEPPQGPQAVPRPLLENHLFSLSAYLPFYNILYLKKVLHVLFLLL